MQDHRDDPGLAVLGALGRGETPPRQDLQAARRTLWAAQEQFREAGMLNERAEAMALLASVQRMLREPLDDATAIELTAVRITARIAIKAAEAAAEAQGSDDRNLAAYARAKGELGRALLAAGKSEPGPNAIEWLKEARECLSLAEAALRKLGQHDAAAAAGYRALEARARQALCES